MPKIEFLPPVLRAPSPSYLRRNRFSAVRLRAQQDLYGHHVIQYAQWQRPHSPIGRIVSEARLRGYLAWRSVPT